MKSGLRHRLIALIALAAAGSISCRGKSSAPATGPSEVRPSLSGLVSDVVSGAPVAGAAVAIQGMTVTTGSDGRYSVTGLTAGQAATLTAKHQGHDNFSQNVTVSAGQAVTNIPMVPAAAAKAAGVWRDAVGGTTVDFSIDTLAETMTLVVDYKGPMDPPPETFRGSYSPTTGVNVTHMSPVAGTVAFRLAPGGRVSGTVTNGFDKDISRTEFTGTATPTEFVLTVTEFLTGGGVPLVETRTLRK